MKPERRVWTRANLIAVVAGLAFALALGAVVIALMAESTRSDDVARLAHDSVQQNVEARYDDCVAGDAVRRALYRQTRSAERSDGLLYRLLPSLDTPEVHELVRRRRAEQLRAFRPRGRAGCTIYALRVVPRELRGDYRVPRPTSKTVR